VKSSTFSDDPVAAIGDIGLSETFNYLGIFYEPDFDRYALKDTSL
jgi:hypothetical protein